MCNVQRHHKEGGGRLCHPDRDVVAEGDDVLLSPPLLQLRNGRSRSSGRSSVDPLELRVNGAGAEVNIY